MQVDDTYTGFVVNDQKTSGKIYKTGHELKCIVLDVDQDKKMLDLSERLDGKPLGKQIKDNEKAFVELTKEHYMIVSFKQDRGQFAVCLLQQGINDNNVASAYEKYSVGDEVDVRVMGGKSDGGLKLTMPK